MFIEYCNESCLSPSLLSVGMASQDLYGQWLGSSAVKGKVEYSVIHD